MSPAGPVTCSWLWTQTRGRASSNSSSPSGCGCARCAAPPSSVRSMSSARRKSWRSVVVVFIAGVLAGATDDDLVLLDRHLDGPVARPVLCVDRAVGHRRVEPQAVALLAVVERSLECGRRSLATRCRSGGRGRPGARGGAWACPRPRRPRSSASSSPDSSARAASASSSAAISASSSARRSISSSKSTPAAPSGASPSGASSFSRLKAAIWFDGHLELVGDPGVGPALADPGPDLIEMWAQRTACH